MGLSESKNVSQMMQQASINLGTQIDQKNNTSVSTSNMVTQVCNNVTVRSDSKENNWNQKVKLLEQACLVHSRARPDTGSKSCSVPWKENPVIIYPQGRSDTGADNSERTAALMKARAWCNESEGNCNQCKNPQGETGIWSEQDFDACAAYSNSCQWTNTAVEVLTSNGGVMSNCVPKCYAIKDQHVCNATEGCRSVGEMHYACTE